MNFNQRNRIAIVGGGIGGLTLAIALQQRNINVVVYEQAQVLKPLGAGIVLARNALKAFEYIGIDQPVIGAGNPLKRFMIKDHKGNTLRMAEPSAGNVHPGYVSTLALHRAELHAALVAQLEPGVIRLDKSCVDFRETESSIQLMFNDGTTESADYVVAADGIHSVFRKKLSPSTSLRYAGYTCWRAITNGLPKGIDTDSASESWGPGKRFGIVPLLNDRAYWFATTAAKQQDPVFKSFTIADLKDHFKDFHFPVREILDATSTEQLLHHDINDIYPVRQFAFRRIVLLGDAAHAATPNLGQGACMAIEDAVVLANCLESIPNIENAFKAYEKKRLPRTTKIMKDSYQMGKFAQAKNPVVVAFRNTLLKVMPESISKRQEDFLNNVTFV